MRKIVIDRARDPLGALAIPNPKRERDIDRPMPRAADRETGLFEIARYADDARLAGRQGGDIHHRDAEHDQILAHGAARDLHFGRLKRRYHGAGAIPSLGRMDPK
jgi:hypothetical protein